MKILLQGVEAMDVYAREFLAALVPHADSATVVAFSGDLGAGKTTFVQGIARGLGVDAHVTSPTFVLEKRYDLVGQKWGRLVHIDAYRLADEHELEVLGWHATVSDPKNLILIEWPEMVADLIPVHAVHITLSGSGDERAVTID